MSLFVDIEKDLGSFRLKVKLETNGGITGLLGASGCGKSMTLRCIAGVETPDRGRILLDGRALFDSEQRIDLPPQQRGVGYLFQSYALFPTMTVRQNLLAGLHREKDKPKKQALYRQAVELLGLQGLEHRRPAELSGGQQQRVALGRILVNRPQVLLLDEPFSALDSHLREQLQLDMLRVLKEFSGDVLLVTHSRDEAYHMCGRLAILDEGEVLRCGATKEVFADPGSRAAARLTGCKNIAAARRTGQNTVWRTGAAWNSPPPALCRRTCAPSASGPTTSTPRPQPTGSTWNTPARSRSPLSGSYRCAPRTRPPAPRTSGGA